MSVATAARPGHAKGKRIRRQAREAQGFELNPPRCLNCEHLQAPQHGAPQTPQGKKVMYVPKACGLGRFEVKSWSICDRWQGRGGEVLEQP